MSNLFEVASRISTPLALAGLIAAAFFFIIRQALAKGLFPQLSQRAGAEILKTIIDRFFVLSLIAMVLGFVGYILVRVLDARLQPEQPPNPSSITETDKDLFAIGSGFGAQSSKILFRLHGEKVAMTATQEVALSRLFENVGFTQGADLVAVIKTTLIKADSEPDSSAMRIDLLSDFTEVKETFDRFAAEEHGRRGMLIFNLGLATTTTYRFVTWFELIEGLEGRQGVSQGFLVESSSTFRELQRPSLDMLQEIILESEELLPEDVRRSCNIVATTDLGNRADREMVLDELVKIHFAFGLSLSKRPRTVESASSYEQSLATAEAVRMIKSDRFDEALSLLDEAQHVPAAHYLRAKAYTLRYLSRRSARRPELDVPGLIRLELERYLSNAPYEEAKYKEDAENLVALIDSLPVSTVDRPGDPTFKFPSTDALLAQMKRELKFLELLKQFHFSDEQGKSNQSVVPSGDMEN